jgi:two-component system, NtrC family, nitrogen regulation sensor histidine kinase NtrY
LNSKRLLFAFFLFLAAGLVSVYFASRPASPQSIADKISGNLEKEIQHADVEAADILSTLKERETSTLPGSDEYSFFLYESFRLKAWSDNKFVPVAASVAESFSLKLLKAGNGNYLAKKWKIDERKFLVAIIPLIRNYTITNDYLKTEWNDRIFPASAFTILESNASLGIPVCIQDQCIFRISFLQNQLPIHEHTKAVAVMLITIAIILSVAGAFHFVKKIETPEFRFALLLAFFIGLRYLMVTLNFPAALIHSDLFNPQVFASSTLNASLGDLVLNEVCLLVLCLHLFRNYRSFKVLKFLYRQNVLAWVVSVVSGVCVLYAVLFPFIVIQTLYNNSSIVLDLSQSLTFDHLRIVSTIAVLLAGICSFLFAHTFIRLLIADGESIRVLASFLLSIVFFSLINLLSDQPYLSALVLGAAYFFLVYFLRLYTSLRQLSFATFVYLFVSIFFLSANGAYAINLYEHKEKIENQFRFASNFLIDRDYFGEYLLRETAEKISQDAFSQITIASPFLSRDAVRQKIRQVFLPSYFNKYDVEIYIFNAAGQPLDNRTDATFSEMIGAYDNDSFRTAYESVYFINSPSSNVTQKYLVKIPMNRMNAIAGYVVLELSLKKIIPESVYPELLVDNSFKEFYRAQDISYAVYSDTSLLFSSGDFNYERTFNSEWLGIPELHTVGITKEGFDHIALEDQNNRIAVVSSPQTQALYMLTNFSFWLVFGLAIIFMQLLIIGIHNYWQGEKLFFSARIQLLLNAAFFLPLIIVSVTTLNLTNISSQIQLNNEYLNKAETFGTQLSIYLDNFLEDDRSDIENFENQLTDLTNLTNLDANVYRVSGGILASSQPLIIENNLVSAYINPVARQEILDGKNLIILKENVGTLEFFVSYAALKAPRTGKLIGILAIPFFQSAYSLEKLQISVLSNILSIFALIFIALVILSYFVSQWLTFPLKFITQTLRRTSLVRTNQPLIWNADDEIGLMVKEYNQMLFKLGESKAELEHTQRERAWREIAQQVAHEIKNPLTPMKLTLQQLERSLTSGNHTNEKTHKAVASLLTQVETLNEIASSFSSFAKMPEPVMQPLELVSLLKRIVDLHVHAGDLTFQSPFKEAFILGDEQLLGRTFSNLIINAFQSAQPGKIMQVKVLLRQEDHNYVIEFQDSGKGILPEEAERIFSPYFTTKQSGSGLGLAISKQAIEQMKGRIWFETTLGEGTTFFIMLPVLKDLQPIIEAKR